SFLIFLPAAGAALLLLLPRERLSLLRGLAVAVTAADFILCILLYARFDPAEAGMQFVEEAAWIPRLGIQYLLGVDGISLPLILLTAFLGVVVAAASLPWIQTRVKEYYICLLLLQTGMLGVFAALDLILFYIFWEAMLIPMYFLIGVWGGPRRIYATIKFFLFTMAGSVLMLLAIFALYFAGREALPGPTFALPALLGVVLPPGEQTWLFLAFALAFAIKVPMVPFHTWLPDAHVEAPTGGSVILAGVLLKMGTYGFLRFALPLFPDATRAFLPLVAWLAIAGILYGALVALAQADVKSLVAYSSVSHLGFVMLGIFALNVQAVSGALLQMVNHGLSTGALFLLVGMLYERRHTRMLPEFGGLFRVIPVYGGVLLVIALSSIGLPGLNGFVGEFLILAGTFRFWPLYGVLGAAGVVLGAWYMLWMVQQVLFGPVRNEANRNLRDLTLAELGVLAPILLLVIWIGVYPVPLLSRSEASVKALLARVEQGAAAVEPAAGGVDPRAYGRPAPSPRAEAAWAALRDLEARVTGGPR
ncbi:MAG: NADH-quinone oxidoreductase subunit M, partial [candidate division NC10 bacterium]|nr:NADH-quinone oxidoreductase subunit M [candidate division NC10 bacterium]